MLHSTLRTGYGTNLPWAEVYHLPTPKIKGIATDSIPDEPSNVRVLCVWKTIIRLGLGERLI